VSDIDIAAADSLRALDLKQPIREADIPQPPFGANDDSSARASSLLGRSRPRGLAISWLMTSSILGVSGPPTIKWPQLPRHEPIIWYRARIR